MRVPLVIPIDQVFAFWGESIYAGLGDNLPMEDQVTKNYHDTQGGNRPNRAFP